MVQGHEEGCDGLRDVDMGGGHGEWREVRAEDHEVQTWLARRAQGG